MPAGAQAAGLLGVDQGAQIVHLRRIRLIDGQPVPISDDRLPADRAAGLVDLETGRWATGRCMLN